MGCISWEFLERAVVVRFLETHCSTGHCVSVAFSRVVLVF